MVSSDKGEIIIKGSANEILAEFLMLSQGIYTRVYKEIFEDDAKKKYLEHMKITATEDEDEFNEAIEENFNVTNNDLESELIKLRDKLKNILDEKDIM